MFILDEKVIRPRLAKVPEPEYDDIESEEPEVIIAGFGRFGQIIGRVLISQKVPFTSLDYSAERVDVVRVILGWVADLAEPPNPR